MSSGRGTYLGSGYVDTAGARRATRDEEQFVAVIAQMSADDTALLSVGAALSLVDQFGSRIGLPLVAGTLPIHV